jgi:hypothetical protein
LFGGKAKKGARTESEGIRGSGLGKSEDDDNVVAYLATLK